MTVRMVARDRTSEHDSDVVGLYEERAGEGRSLVFELARQFDDQDRALGQDAYSMSLDTGATGYAPVERCQVSPGSLRLQLKPEAAGQLGLPEALR